MLLCDSADCSGLAGRVGRHVYCSVDDTCMGFSCCANLKLFIYRHALTAFVRYDPCLDTITMGIDTWTKRFKMNHIDDFSTYDRMPLDAGVCVICCHIRVAVPLAFFAMHPGENGTKSDRVVRGCHIYYAGGGATCLCWLHRIFF